MTKVTAPKIIFFTVATTLLVVGFVGLVTFEEPPAFMGYLFGFLNGANVMLLLVIARDYWEK